MRTLIIALALVLASANPAAATLYRCEATGVADPLSTGSLKEPGRHSQTVLDAGFRLTFDAVSGLLRIGGLGEPWRYTVVSPGSKSNDLTALHQGVCLASCPVAVLRIRVWEPSMPFVFVDFLGSVWSGRCSM